MLPEDYNSWDQDKLADLADEQLLSENIFWLSSTQTPAQAGAILVAEKIDCDFFIEAVAAGHDHDQVLINTAIYPEYTYWIAKHATRRDALTAARTAYHHLPLKPAKI